MHRDNWDDLRFVLAVAESGSVSGAARMLGVNHATVLRRVAAFEERQGCEVFERTAHGYRVPADRLRVIEAAREVDNAVRSVEQILKGRNAQLSGSIRITSTDSFCTAVLPEIVAKMTADAPGLRVELQCTNAHLDLSRLHADISVRPALRLDDDLVGERVGNLELIAYQSAHHPTPKKWFGLTGALSRSRAGMYMAEDVAADKIGHSADSFLALREMIAVGLGCGYLPSFIARNDPRLMRCEGHGYQTLQVPVWVASHIDLVGAQRIRAVRERLTAELRKSLCWSDG